MNNEHVCQDGSWKPYREDQCQVCKKVAQLESSYHELLFAVSTKHPKETRHETALRYIQEREINPTSSVASQERLLRTN